MWTVTLRDHTGGHQTGEGKPATTTQVDKAAFTTQEEAIAAAMVQLGIHAIYNANVWWEIF
jgi:hypothetical protein